MTESADRVLVYGDFYAKSLDTMNSAYLSAGTLELKGDFIQKNVSQKGNFCASGTHRTIFSGDKKQTITFSDNYSYFNVVDIQNASEAGVYAPQGIFCNTLVKNGNKVTTDVVGTEGWQLTGDEVIEGDLELVSGELNLNGHTLTVKGNLIQSKGNVNINGGTLVVEGDYRIQGSSEENGEIIYKESSGNLLMTDKNSHLIVKGSFVMGSMYSHKDKLTAGMIEVAGDVRAVGYYQLDNFALTGDIVLILNGTAKQTVNLSNTNFSTMRVANLEIRNESEAGVVFETELPVTTSVKDYGNHTEGTLLIKPEVSFTDGSYQGNIRVADTGRLSGLKEIGGNLTVEAYPLSLTGNLKVKGGLSILNGRYLDLNGKECQVGGNVIIKGGYIKLNKGRLVCDGDLDLAYYDGTNSYLAMAYEEDYVLVKGNVRVSSRAMAKTVMEKGTFEFQGNFTQTVTENTANFIVGNGCKVVLSGNGLQTVSFASKESYFTYVDLQNKSEEGVYSEQGIHCKHIELNGNRYRTGKSGNEGFILTEDTEWNGDFLLASGTLDLNGDFLLASGTLDLNGKKLTVHGNLLQTGGTVKVNDGELRVEGNYEIKGENDEGCFASLFMTKEADRVYVTGNFVMASYADHSDCLAAGSLSVEGDFIQKTTLLATNFATQDKFELIMCGKQKQSILMESASLKNSGIANLTIDNTSEEGVSLNEVLVTNAVKVKTGKTSGYLTLASTTRFEDNTFDGDIIVKETITYPSDLHIKGNMKNSGYLRFQGNLTVDGEFSMNNFLYLEGHTLEIGGKTNIKGCDIKLNKGSVICHGDVTLGYDTSRASGFYMVNEAEYVLIEGNLYVDTGKPVTLTKGTLELQGDFIQNRYYDKNTFSQNIDCKTILSGREKQTVHFSESGSRLGTVEIKNESAEGVYFQNDSIRVLKLIRNGCRVTCDGTGTYGWTLEEDTVLEGDLNIAADVLDLNGHQLTINGNLYIGSGEVYLNGGKLDVKESLRLQNVDKNGVHTASTGILRMNDKEDKVSVGKDFIIQTVQNGKDCLTAGTLEIAGDFRQLLSDGKGADSYQPSGTHTTVFCGTKEQNISFANKNISWFQNLSVKNTKANVKLLSFMTCKGEAEDKEKKVECQNSYHMYINSLAQLKEGTFGGNVYVSNSDTLTQNITIRGCLSTNSTLDLDGHEMTVGSLKKSAGRLVLNKGKLYVLSDLIIEGYSCLTMTNEKDFIRVNGNMELITNNGVDNTLTAGTLELCGDLKVSNTLTATGTHKTILSGKKNSQGRDYIQTIKFISGGKFNELVLKKNRESCYLFSDDVENLCNHLKIEKSDEEPPLKVKGVQATKVTASSVNLSWKASTDNEEVVGYRVYRNSKLIGITTATAYNDTGLRPETSYNYTICAYDKAENVSENSDIVGIVTESDETAPSTPESMRLVTRTGSSVTVAWNRSKDNVEVAGYRIYRNDELVATVTSGETLYKDMACEDDVTYSYIVEAYDAAGNVSGQSKEVISKVRKPELKKIEPGDGAFLGGDQICLRAYYTDSGNSTGNKVRFQYCEREEDEWKDINVSYVGQQTHNETTLFSTYTWDISRLNSGEYKVRIILYDGDENMTTREVRYTIDKDGPKTPDYIEAISDNGTVDIVWSESASAKCKEYEIYRLEAGDTYKKIAVAAGRGTTTYRDRNVKEGDTYSYYIIPVDSFGQKGKATGLAKVTATADKENPVVESMTINKKRINKGTRIAVKASDNIRVASISVQYLLDKEWVEVGNIQEGEGGDNRYRQSAKGRRLYFPGDCKG